MTRLVYLSIWVRGDRLWRGLKATHGTLDSLYMDFGTFEDLWVGKVIL